MLLHGFFVAGEFGIVTVERTRIEQLAEKGSRPAKSTLRALETLSFQLSGAQLGITVTSLIVGFLIEPVIAPLFTPAIARPVAIAVGLVLATSIEMVIAELIPKNLAIARPQVVAFAVATPLRAINLIFKPLIVVLNSSANLTVRLLGIEPRDELHSVHSLEELQILIRSSRQGGELGEEEAALLARSIDFRKKTAADILIPRGDVTTLRSDQTLKEVVEVALESGHSRFPVIGKDIDDVVGVMHVKDTYRIDRGRRSRAEVAEVMRDPLIVPESRNLAELLRDMRRERTHLATVVDEYGGNAGIVTLEDLLEEIVGDIEDEHDPSAARVRLTQPPSGIHVVSGGLHPDEVREQTGFQMPEGQYETLAGFLLSVFERIPKSGDHVSHAGWEFKVVEMDGNRIAEVLMVGPSRSEQEVTL
ncbi:MAG TPA: hemolysin family protein [Actinomycetota bacterium]|nr:hemolysin family protein [Actinomycetota bacterium]